LRLADVERPATWATIRQAVATYQAYSWLAGIGFVLTANDPYCMIDLDNCLDDGVLSDKAAYVLSEVNSYTEISPSGNGLKLLVRCPGLDFNR
jgi:putative DNA primase/helicase